MKFTALLLAGLVSAAALPAALMPNHDDSASAKHTTKAASLQQKVGELSSSEDVANQEAIRKKLEFEKIALEKTMQEKEENYVKTKGQKYMKRDDFRQYAANLREKNTQYK